MHYLEDYIGLCANSFNKEVPEKVSEFIYSLYDQLSLGRTLTTRQGNAAIKMLKTIANIPSFSKTFPKVDKKDLKAALAERRWKNELRASVERRREARHLGDNIVALSFPSIPEMRKAVKSLDAEWHEQLYLVTVKSSNLENLINFLGVYSFDISKELEEYLALCMASKRQISHIIGLEGGAAAVNVCDDELLANFILHMCKGQRI